MIQKSSAGSKTRERNSWEAMKRRCLSPSHLSFASYGGRGIGIHEPWLEFENFLRDMGPRPPGTSLDRINNDLGYGPENCRWATREQQNENRRVACGERQYAKLHPEQLARGERHGRSKLTSAQVIKIRELHTKHVTLNELADMFGVVPQTIGRVVSCKIWGHVK